MWPALGADLGPLLCLRATLGYGSVNVQDNTLSNVCPQAKDPGVQTEKMLYTDRCHLQMGCACLNQDHLRVPAEMLFK